MFSMLFTALHNAYADSDEMLNFSEKPSSDPTSKTPVYTPYDEMFQDNMNYSGPHPFATVTNCNRLNLNDGQRKICQDVLNRKNANLRQEAQTKQLQADQKNRMQKPRACASDEYRTLLVNGAIGNQCSRSSSNFDVLGVDNDPCKWTERDYALLYQTYVACGGNTFSEKPLPDHINQTVKNTGKIIISNLKTKVSLLKEQAHAPAEAKTQDSRVMTDANEEYKNLFKSSETFRQCESKLNQTWKSMPEEKRKELKNDQVSWLRKRFIEANRMTRDLSYPQDKSYCMLNEARIKFLEMHALPVGSASNPTKLNSQANTPEEKPKEPESKPIQQPTTKVVISIEPETAKATKSTPREPAASTDPFSYD
jgi:hypothetical protein